MTTPTKPQHTPEPWSYAVTDEDWLGKCHRIGPVTIQEGCMVQVAPSAANAERIVACVNLLATHPDLSAIEILPAGTVAQVRARIPQIKAALKLAIARCQAVDNYVAISTYVEAVEASDALLALLPAPAAGKAQS